MPQLRQPRRNQKEVAPRGRRPRSALQALGGRRPRSCPSLRSQLIGGQPQGKVQEVTLMAHLDLAAKAQVEQAGEEEDQEVGGRVQWLQP